MKTKPPDWGEYNASTYFIFAHQSLVYQAGNHPRDSQVYAPPFKGVGLRQMRSF
jgi:hypothetical protein